MTFRAVFLLTFVILTFPFLLQAQLPGPGVECNCTATGDYIDPDPGVLPEVITGDTSPGGIYSISVSGSGPYNIVIHRQSDGATVYSTSLQNGYWGFSPDDDRFVFHTLSSGQLLVTLVDLTIPSGNKVIWSNTLSASDRSIHFSPNGNYLVCSALNSATSASLLVIDAHTGDPSYDSSPFIFLPGGDTTDVFGAAGWGFSPDLSDRTLFYAFVNGSGLLEWRMVNLQTGEASNQTFVSHISGFWQFSPCGDMLGLVIQTDPSHMKIALHQTAHPQSSALATRDINQVTTVSFRSTALSHIVTVGGNDDVLTANEAGVACFIVPDSLIFTPRTVVGGNAVAGRVVLSSPARAGGVTVSLSSSNPAVATVPSSVLVPAGQQEKTFTVQTSIVGTATKPVLSATSDGTTIYDTLTVTPLELVGYDADRTDVIGGDTVNTTITLSAAAPGPGISVTLVSSKPSLVSVSSPANIATGETTTTAFLVTTPVASLDSAVILATALGDTLTVTIRVNPYVTLSFEPDTIVGGNPVVYLASRVLPAPPGGIQVQANSSDSSVLIPPPLTIPSGGTIVWVNPLETRGVSQPTTVYVSTVFQGKSIGASLTVLPAKLESLHALSDSGCAVGGPLSLPNTFIAGATILFEASLDGESPPGPAVAQLSLTSTRPDLAPVPENTTIPARSRKILLLIPTSAAVNSTEEVILTAQYGGISKSDTVRLLSPPISYTFTDITPPGDLYVYDMEINNVNQVLLTDGDQNGFLWTGGTFQKLDSLTGLHAIDAALNDSGWVGGADSLDRPAIWDGHISKLLPSIDSILATGYVTAITNDGQAIGVFSDRIFQTYTVLWRNDSVQMLGPYPPFEFRPVDINESGLIVLDGSYYHGAFDWARGAFLWENGTITRIYNPYGSEYYYTMYGRALNDDGTVVLSFDPIYNYGDGTFYVRSNGVTTTYSSLDPFNRINPLDINMDGTIVGGIRRKIEGETSLTSAFVFTDGRMYDLQCLAPFPPGWIPQEAVSINDAGAIVGRALVNGGDRAFLLTPAAAVTTVQRNNNTAIPTVYSLEQNYPNPFNPSTRIRYSLPTTAKVRLSVYDLLGREVASLVNEIQPAGYKEVVWNAAGLSSGVYFYRIDAVNPQSGDMLLIDVRRMVLVK